MNAEKIVQELEAKAKIGGGIALAHITGNGQIPIISTGPGLIAVAYRTPPLGPKEEWWYHVCELYHLGGKYFYCEEKTKIIITDKGTIVNMLEQWGSDLRPTYYYHRPKVVV